MNGNNHNKNLMCNENQILKNLPLKKRRAYFLDSPLTTEEQDENHSKIIKPSYSKDNSFSTHIPVVPTPPSSPHIEFLRQQYTNIQQKNYFHPTNYNYHLAQQYQLLIDQQQQQYGYSVVEGDKQKRSDLTIDEHFRKSLGENYNTYSGRCLTPDDSSSNSSSIERTPVDSIEEHFARSLAKFWPLLNEDETSTINHQITESVVDDHFAKALGSTTWEKLKEKS